MSRAPNPQSEQILALVIGYRQAMCIAERVLPVLPVNEELFKWFEVSLKDSLQMPDSKVGRKSRPNEMEIGSTERTAQTVDHAIDDFVPATDVERAKGRLTR